MGRGSRTSGSSFRLRAVPSTREEDKQRRAAVEASIHKRTLEEHGYYDRGEGNNLNEHEFVQIINESKALTEIDDRARQIAFLVSGNKSDSEKAKASLKKFHMLASFAYDEYIDDKLDLDYGHIEEVRFPRADEKVVSTYNEEAIVAYRARRNDYLDKKFSGSLPEKESEKEMLYQLFLSAEELENHPESEGVYKALAYANKFHLKKAEAGIFPDAIALFLRNNLAIASLNLPETREAQRKLLDNLDTHRKYAGFSDRSPVSLPLVVPDGWGDVLEYEYGTQGQNYHDPTGAMISIFQSEAEKVIDGVPSWILAHEMLHSSQDLSTTGYSDDVDRYILEGLTDNLTEEKMKSAGADDPGYYPFERALVKEMVSEIARRENQSYLEALEQINLLPLSKRNEAVLSALNVPDRRETFGTLIEDIKDKMTQGLKEKEYSAFSLEGEKIRSEVIEKVIADKIRPYFSDENKRQQKLF